MPRIVCSSSYAVPIDGGRSLSPGDITEVDEISEHLEREIAAGRIRLAKAAPTAPPAPPAPPVAPPATAPAPERPDQAPDTTSEE